MARSQTEKTAPVILWVRKDLRVDDNRALSAACASGRPVVAVYIRCPDDAETGPLGAAQSWWLHHSLEAFAKTIADLGASLVLRTGAPQSVLTHLIEETGTTSVFWNKRFDTTGRDIDSTVERTLQAAKIDVASFTGALLHDPEQVKTKTGGPYRVYTPFWRALDGAGKPVEPVDAPDEMKPFAGSVSSENLSDWSLLPDRDWAKDFPHLWTPGEASAREKLEAFLQDTIDDYRQSRERTWERGTSMLSPHLAMGEITPARIWQATTELAARQSDDVVTFRKEIVWREFGYHLLFHHPMMPTQNLNRKYDHLGWQDRPEDFRRWTRGMTGFPIVDAGMRQLWRYGTMHNRVRMIVGSFLVKDLMIDWRRGERWFRDTLVDADPASNAMNWQWVAGCGADASPFFRVFNPTTQGEKFDPDGLYVKQHVPELAGLPASYIHRPSEAPASVLETAGIVLGETYPTPIVDHAQARDRALAAYRNVKDAA